MQTTPELKDLNALFNRLDNGESWSNVRGEVQTYLFKVTARLEVALSDQSEMGWRIDDIREAINKLNEAMN
jgi:hypothetical protein